jgi:hypothetical protein
MGTVAGFGPEPFGVEVLQAPADKWRQKLTMPRGTFVQGWDGKQGYRVFNGNVMPPDDVDAARRQAQFAPPVTLASLLAGPHVIGDAPLDKGNAHIIEGKQGSAIVRLWFDAATGLLARMTVRVPTPVGDLPQQVDYEDYRVVDGVKLPFTIKTNQGGETATAKYDSIKHNAPLDEAELAAPKPSAPPPAQGK